VSSLGEAHLPKIKEEFKSLIWHYDARAGTILLREYSNSESSNNKENSQEGCYFIQITAVASLQVRKA
jgi:hypothetical protein